MPNCIIENQKEHDMILEVQVLVHTKCIMYLKENKNNLAS